MITPKLSTPSFGITKRGTTTIFEGVIYAFNSLFRDHLRSGVEGRGEMSAFNSLFRDHLLLAFPRVKETRNFQLPLSGSHSRNSASELHSATSLSTPSFGITNMEDLNGMIQ